MSLNLKYKSTHKASPPHKSKGKSTKCTPYCTFRPKIPIAACDLAPQTEMTTVCLVFCINPSSMVYTIEYTRRALGCTLPPVWLVHRISTARKEKGGGRLFFPQIEPN